MKYLFTLFLLSLSTTLLSGKMSSERFIQSDSAQVDLMTEFSLFYESYKNKDYKFAFEHGFVVINNDPSDFLKYKPFRKIEEVIVQLHDSVATTEEDLNMYADTLLYLYDKAIEMGAKNPEYFQIQKAYRMDVWDMVDANEKIAAYEDAFKEYPGAYSYYKDRLGVLYLQNMSDDNDYKMKGLDLYFSLADAEPENETWINRIDSFIDDPKELPDIREKAWKMDMENLEKAYSYAETCIQVQEYERAVEPLLFLTEKSPDVINYWRKLATVYTKLGRNDKAIKAYKTLIELEPNNRDNYYNLALIYKNIGQLSVCRSYLQKAYNASEKPWDIPIMVEAQLYEQAARECGFEFMDKCVYQLAVDTYKKAAAIGGSQEAAAKKRVSDLAQSVPQSEDYFFRKYKSGNKIQIEGKCYDWIKRSIVVP